MQAPRGQLLLWGVSKLKAYSVCPELFTSIVPIDVCRSPIVGADADRVAGVLLEHAVSPIAASMQSGKNNRLRCIKLSGDWRY